MYEIKNKSIKRGGKRSGAGRKSLYGVPTKAIRVPENMVAEVRDFIESQNAAEYELPLLLQKLLLDSHPQLTILWILNLI